MRSAEIERLLRSSGGLEVWNREGTRRNAVLSAIIFGLNLEGLGLQGAIFQGCDLDGPRFKGAKLADADFSRAHLAGADFSNADLRGCSFDNAVLTACNFIGANLDRASFWNTSLLGCCIAKSTLRGANFEWATIRRGFCNEADFDHAVMGDMSISADLSVAKNLHTVKHISHSDVSLSVLQEAEREWPMQFLRGCGLQDVAIQTAQSLQGQPIKFYSAFISYSTADDAFAVRLHDKLQAEGVRCWLDKKAILPGDNIPRKINEALRTYDKVLLCCSEASLGSWWVSGEIARAIERERTLQQERGTEVLCIIPLDLDGALFAAGDALEYGAILRKRHAAKFGGWERDQTVFDREIGRVILALRADEGAREAAPSPRL